MPTWTAPIACLQAADRPGFDIHLDAALSLAERVGETYVLWQAKTVEAMRWHLTAIWIRSQQEAEAAFAIGADGVPEAMATYGAQLMAIQRVAGKWSDLNDMAELIAAAASQNPGLPVLRTTLAERIAISAGTTRHTQSLTATLRMALLSSNRTPTGCRP